MTVTVTVRQWYVGRTRREQRLLLLMAVLALLVLAWLFVRVMDSAYEDALTRNLEAVDRHGRILSLADSMNGKSRAPASENADLQVVITETASQSGLTLQGANAAGPNAIDISLGGTTAPAVGQWLRDLQARGIFVEQMRMTPQPDGSLTVSGRLARQG